MKPANAQPSFEKKLVDAWGKKGSAKSAEAIAGDIKFHPTVLEATSMEDVRFALGKAGILGEVAALLQADGQGDLAATLGDPQAVRIVSDGVSRVELLVRLLGKDLRNGGLFLIPLDDPVDGKKST